MIAISVKKKNPRKPANTMQRMIKPTNGWKTHAKIQKMKSAMSERRRASERLIGVYHSLNLEGSKIVNYLLYRNLNFAQIMNKQKCYN